MNKKIEQHVDLILSMSVDFKTGKIGKELYLSNLEMILDILKKL